MSARFVDSVRLDLRFGLRTLLKNPGFAAVAVLTLALGIGANAAIFSVVNAVLLRPLPWSEPGRAVMIWSKWTAFDKTWVADGEVIDYRRRARTLDSVASWGEGQVNVTGDGSPVRVPYGQVTANLFATLGAQPIIGRTFTEREDLPNGPNLVVIGHNLWTSRYAGDPAIAGRRIQLNGTSYEIVGVMPRDFVLPTDFQNPEPTQLWVPLQMDPASTNHGSHGLYAAARLKPDATVAQAAAELHGIAQAMTSEGLYPTQMQFDTVVVSLQDEVMGGVRRAILVLFGAVAFLLLIACANVANLLLARAEARQREIAVRSALGAGSLRVVRQLLTESLLLTIVSAAVGLLLAAGGVRLLAWWNPANIPRVAAVAIDWRVAGFTAAVAMVTTIFFGLAPALRTLQIDLTDALKDGGQGSSTGGARQHFRNALVVSEMALAVVLLIGAGLMIRTLWSLQRVDTGINPDGVLTMRLSLPQASYQQPEKVIAFYQQLLDRVRTLPGVQQAGAIRSLPLASTIGDFGLRIEGYVPPAGTNAKGDWEIATDGYLEAMGERVVRGRTISRADTSDSLLVALVNEELAAKYWSGQDPIGKRMKIGGGGERPWITVVGLVRNVRHNGLTAVVKEKFYVPHTQWHKSIGNPIRSMSLVIKTAGDPALVAGPVRDEVRKLDADIPVADVRTMDDVMKAAMSTPRFTGGLLALFAAIALVLSAIGIYGVLSYLVSRRTREIGIRVAIGASRVQVLRMVLGSALGLAAVGVVIGLGAAAWAMTFLKTLLHGVQPMDPATYVAVGATLMLVAVAACAVPAWRATQIAPVTALKSN